MLSFLSTFPSYLDILVQCTRKTEVRSWRTLFAHLPPPRTLFEAALENNMLKTAGGYLLILNTLEEGEGGSEQCTRLLLKAQEMGDWDLCKELVRFLMALDETGEELRRAVQQMGISPSLPTQQEGSPSAAASSSFGPAENVRLRTPQEKGNERGKRLTSEGEVEHGSSEDDEEDT